MAGLLKAEGVDHARTAPDTTSRKDAEQLFGAGASTAEANDAAALTWPKPAAEVLLEYVRERNAPEFDPDHELRPVDQRQREALHPLHELDPVALGQRQARE
jgi:hypothetical protein